MHRIVELSGRCNDILLSSAKNKIGYYLQQALDELNVYLETACNKYQGEGRRWRRPLQSAMYRPHCSPSLYKQCNDLAVLHNYINTMFYFVFLLTQLSAVPGFFSVKLLHV